MISRPPALAEIGLFYAAVFAAIWLGHGSPLRPPLLVAGLALVGVCALSNRRHGDSLEKIGLSSRRFRPCLRLTLKTASVPLLLLAAAAAAGPVPPWPKLLFGLFGYPLWAFAQQYALQSFMANRWRDALGDRPLPIAFANGLLFALVHFPNPILLAFCFAGGTLFTWIFLRTPHLVPIALAHAAAGFLIGWLFHGFPAALMIGPGYLKWTRALAEPAFAPWLLRLMPGA